MGLFNKLKEPVFLKESSNAEIQLEMLRALEQSLNQEGQAILKQDIKCLEYGIAGEKNIAFELKNSHMPMYILHDIYLEDGELGAQIDYLVFTRKLCFVIECKNLFGDVEINSAGDFIRTTEFAGKKKKEGIYSPITQNQRHLELMKKLKTDSKGNVFTRFLVGRYFEDLYKSIVVLANPKTVLYAKFAKKDVKEKVIRADQLVKYIKVMNEKSKETATSDEGMMEWAQSYMNFHKEVVKDYLEKYEQYRLAPKSSEKIKEEVKEVVKKEIAASQTDKVADDMIPNENVHGAIEETELFKELKAYRLMKSREENLKPYLIYNDNQLKDLIAKMPKTIQELQNVVGFREVKANKYGDDILRITEKYR